MEGVLVYSVGEEKASEGMKRSGEGQAYGVSFMYRWRSTKAAYQIGGARLLQGPDGMDDESHKDCALTHFIAQGIYYLQILSSKLALLERGIYQGQQVRLQFRPESCAALYYGSLLNSCTELASFRLPLLPWR
jgi:hypothetical protein